MKTTVDLPGVLVKQVKRRAQKQGRKLNEALADLVRKGLAVETDMETDSPLPAITRDKKTGLPLIECKHAAAAHERLTPKRVADILLAQELDLLVLTKT